jgi:flagellar motor switch protein FliM
VEWIPLQIGLFSEKKKKSKFLCSFGWNWNKSKVDVKNPEKNELSSKEGEYEMQMSN